MGPLSVQEGGEQDSGEVEVPVDDAQGVHIDQVADGQPQEGMKAVVLRQVLGVEMHVRQLGEDVGCSQVAAVSEDVHFGGNGWVGGQDVQLLDDWGVIMLVRLGSAVVAQVVIGVLAGVQMPCVCEIDILPEIVGRMAVKAAGDEGGVLEVVRGQEGEDELEQLGREGLNLLYWSAGRPVCMHAIGVWCVSQAMVRLAARVPSCCHPCRQPAMQMDGAKQA